MTPRPAVSVLMPVLNPHPGYFPAAVASILGQTLADWELVIVEDPSPSSAAELLRPFDDRRIRLITNPERTGLVAQRNRSLAEARAALVAMLDADDVAEPTRLAEQTAFLAANPGVAVVGCRLRVIDAAGADVGERAYPAAHDDILRTMPRYNAVPQPGVLARKESLLRQGGYEFEWPAEDYDLWSRMLLAGERFANIDAPLTRYRVHPQSGSKGTRLRRLLDLTAEVKRRYWWGRMTWRDRLRYRAERALRLVPAGLVYRLFAAVTYRRPRPNPG
jgi:glycosyltransferase involved in cell wall biosynthesis